jgi:transcriptional regulator with XRE-family HTH domain
MPDIPATTPPEEPTDGISSALIKARNELGLTQAQLSEQSGISRSAIKAYETGRNMPGSRELKALCRTLKVSPTVLLYGSDDAFASHIGAAGDAPEDYDHTKARWQLLALARMLPADELAALMKLLRAIAVARHGVEMVNRNVDAAGVAAFALIGDELPKTLAHIGALADAYEQDQASAGTAPTGTSDASEVK